MKTGLLVSVRTASEAALAHLGGADLIDVKEPSRGSLGRPQDDVIRSVLNQIDGKHPVSAAQGELREGAPVHVDWKSLTYLKWGLSGCAELDWQSMLRRHAQRLGSRVVPVAYADAQRARSPMLEEVLTFACGKPWPNVVVLIDTFDKSFDKQRRRMGLLDWYSLEEIASWCERCRAKGVRIALAGSLRKEDVEKLLPLRPDWIGVRGAVCEGDSREGTLSIGKVHELSRLFQQVTV